MGGMKQCLVSDALWSRIAPLLPAEPPKPRGGRPRVSDRAVLNGILYVLRTGIQWKHLPTELGFGSGVTVWRRVLAWQQAGVWEGLHRLLLDELGEAGQLDWRRIVVDTRSVPAKKGDSWSGRTPRTVGSRAANTISSPMQVASRLG
jgi:transposase